MLSIPHSALEQLSALLLERAGLKIAADGFHGLKLALSARMPALGIVDAEEYVRRLRQLAGEHELRSLLPLVTVGYTEFFRDPRQFGALEARILPDLLEKARREIRRVAIWSAGCATGEEPYSLAMVLAEKGAKPSEVDLLASDLNPAAIENAKLGRYPWRRFVGVQEARRARFFRPVDDGLEVAPELRALVRFEGQNLAAPVYAKVEPGSLDLILCRNVIIYFDLPTIRGVMERFLNALRPGGLLLLGYSESLFKVYDRFEMIEVEGAFVYRRPLTTPQSRVEKALAYLPRSTPAPGPVPPQLPPPLASAPVRKTAEVPALAPRPRPAEPAAAAPAPSATPSVPRKSPPERLDAIVKQMERGDFDGALAALRKLTEDEPNDLDAELTLGNIYSLTGQNDLARSVFNHTLAREPLCVEARVFGGVAAIQAGKLSEAKAELSKALFLEPSLAIGHYLLAQVQERTGDHEGARRSYRNAISQVRSNQRPLAGHYPDMPDSTEAIARAARYALSALEEIPIR